jgi:hypothetical protein
MVIIHPNDLPMEIELFDIIKAVNRLTDKMAENTGKLDSLLAAWSQIPSEELNKQFVNEETACAILHRCPNTIRKMRKLGDLPYLKVGKKVLYKLSDLRDFLENKYRV